MPYPFEGSRLNRSWLRADVLETGSRTDEAIRVTNIGDATLYLGDVLAVLAGLPDESVHCVVTSPPYWGLRSYGTDGQVWDGDPECAHDWGAVERIGGGKQDVDGKRWQHTDGGVSGHGKAESSFCFKCGAWFGELGLEPTPELFVQHLVAVFREVRRVLRKDGTAWVNLGDSYAGSGKGPSNSLQPDASCIGNVRGMNRLEDTPTSWLSVPAGLKPEDLVGIPWRVAFALQADGWYLRSDIIWAKPNPMPESVTDRPTKAHEYVFLLTKSARYWYDADAVREGVVVGTLTDRVDTGRFSPERGFPGATDHGNGRLGDNPGGMRNRRTVWTIATEPFPGAHFATFPRKLVEPCILAGCPRKVCPGCGAPWVREVERVASEPQREHYHGEGHVPAHRGGNGRPGGYYPDAPRTIGEHPTCTCGLPPVPGTVLDPFGGSMTTMVVALSHGRRGVAIELKPEYFEMGCNRLRHGTVDPEEVAYAERQGVLFG